MSWRIVLPIILVVAAAGGYVVFSSLNSPYQPGERAQLEAVTAVEAPAAPESDTQPAGEAADDADMAATDAETQTETATAAPRETPAAGLVAPPRWLNDSDSAVRKAVSDIEEALLDWLTPDEQLRKWVLMVDQMADGALPVKHRPVSYPVDAFLVYKSGGNIYQDGGNYARWTPLVNAVTAIDPAVLADYYRSWLPMLEKAYAELGKQSSFDQRFRKMLDHMVYAELAPESATLQRPHIFYKYSDPRLEAAPALTKWLWRMGEDNMLRLQNFLRALKGELA